ncbi:dTMP kinase [Pseudoteredinibacter isoporae]|nr:dTMP kinase [Pseudoteredinibacter isoporae]NHO87492.1 dTMP kinase [Pseudoteredinibacter isoporae]NIB24177.1 dTMP kinase [Pseudoteredinibacter isoporae]
MKPGLFITVEGTEGVGKTSNMNFIRETLEARGIEVVCTREPGGTPLAEELRELLLSNREEKVDETAELLMMFAARAQHLQSLIIPSLMRGAWVLCDRFTDATYAYQGAGRGLSMQTIAQLESIVQGQLQPDATFILDVDVRLGLERASKRSEADRFESEHIEFFERIRACYLSRAEQQPKRYFVINAGQTLDKVQQDIHSQLKLLLP